MKTQNFGWSNAGMGCTYVRPGFNSFPKPRKEDAKKHYLDNRSNGLSKDSPSRDIPFDGRFSDWIKAPDDEKPPVPMFDGRFREGWVKGDYDGWYRIRYQEGPGDKAWMEERDGNYLARLEREGQVAKAAELRVSLPPSHPHYRSASPEVPTLVPTESSGGASGSAPAPAP